MANLPNGLSGAQTQWIDLFGEGISGALTQCDGSWYCKRNLSPLTSNTKTPVQKSPSFLLEPMERLDLIPNLPPDSPEFDLVGDGYHNFIPSESQPTGFFKATEEDTFGPFLAFTTTVNQNLKHEVRFLDIDGDGRPELVLAGESLSSLGVEGFHEAQSFNHWSPSLLFCNDSEVIHSANFCGDGLANIVGVRNGESCYWPNLGNGSFGDQIVLDNSPWFDYSDQFSTQRVLLTDVDDSGTTDIVYLHNDRPMLYFNQSGNEWSDAVHLSEFLPTNSIASVTALDLHGQGTPSLVWFSSLPSDARKCLRYLRLTKTKPHLMIKVSNNLGCTTAMTYATSTQFYLEDKLAGSLWATRLPFPVHVVCSRVVEDVVSKNRFTTRYAYHHCYYDGDDAEFRGFGMVESWSSELVNTLSTNPGLNSFFSVNEEEEYSLPPTYTKQWFHLGNIAKADKVSSNNN
ncbi:insecticide toxin TcdB middle/N-terminal region-domain-containing protein [Rhexocercosporidium sp. MPI-PUGE-AT-0058]|nr:insecticide toxin TcdB middle/N-terminal region-domain-containing protein [Rhexocercosporidium sp. MPI-PUGE-AT-0058]